MLLGVGVAGLAAQSSDSRRVVGRIGLVERLSAEGGNVAVERQNGQRLQAEAGTQLRLGDLVEVTGAVAATVETLERSHRAALAPGTTAEVGVDGLFLRAGRIVVAGARRVRGLLQGFSVRTSLAAAVTQGTTFTVSIDSSAMVVSVLEGSVILVRGDDTTRVDSLETVTVTADGIGEVLPFDPATMTDDLSAVLLRLSRRRENRRRGSPARRHPQKKTRGAMLAPRARTVLQDPSLRR